jgi:hypothetical protein
MNHLATLGIDHYVSSMAIAQAKYISDGSPYGSRMDVIVAGHPPLIQSSHAKIHVV